jgi:hypothetical protein
MSLTQEQINNLPDLDDAQVGSFIESPLKGNLVCFQQMKELDNTNYHNGDIEIFGIPAKRFLSSSLLKNCITPTHIKQYISERREVTKEMTRGTAMHTMVLEPGKFNYVLFDDSKKVAEIGGGNPRATKVYKEWKAEFEEKNAGKSILPKEDFQLLWEASVRLDECDLIKNLMNIAIKESSFFSKFLIGEKEIFIKIRPDAYLTANGLKELGINDGDMVIVSVKTTRDASPENFKYEFYKHDYHISESFYHDVISEIFPEIKVHTLIVAIEPETGLFMCHKLTDDTIDKGRFAYDPLLENWMNTDIKKFLAERIPKGYEIMKGSLITDL